MPTSPNRRERIPSGNRNSAGILRLGRLFFVKTLNFERLKLMGTQFRRISKLGPRILMRCGAWVLAAQLLLSFCSSTAPRSTARKRSIRAASLDRGSFSHGRFLQTGVASYYGADFHGRKTANGEIYNRNDLTAAHRTLDFNTRLRVTNLGNGRTVTVRVNDRGPYAKGRIIDLSEEAGRQIGLDVSGIAKVKIEVLQ